MKKIFVLLFLMFSAIMTYAQSPSGLPSPRSDSGFAQYNYLRTLGGLISSVRDTNWLPTYTGSLMYWQNAAGGDSSLWIFNGKTSGQRFNKVVKPISLTTNGTNGASTLVNGVLNIPVYTPQTITLTTTGTGGASTFNSGTGALNIPIYTPQTRLLTVNGSALDLSADRTFTITTTGVANRTTVTGGTGLTPTVDIASTYAGQASITTVGTLTSGAIGTGFTPIPHKYLADSTISGVALGNNLFALTMDNLGAGAASGSIYNGSGVVKLSYNTIGAVPTTTTVAGFPLTNNVTLANLNLGAYLTGGPYNGSAAVTIAVSATNNNNPNTIVSRDVNGAFSMGALTATGATISAMPSGSATSSLPVVSNAGVLSTLPANSFILNTVTNPGIQSPASYNVKNAFSLAAGGSIAGTTVLSPTDTGAVLNNNVAVSGVLNQLNYTSTTNRTINSSNPFSGNLSEIMPSLSGTGTTITVSQLGGSLTTMSGLTAAIHEPNSATNSQTISHLSALRTRLYADNSTSGGRYNITNFYGVSIEPSDQFVGSNVTNRWGVYQSGVNDKNYFAGTVQMSKYSSGTLIVDASGNISVALPGTPGTGTVASVGLSLPSIFTVSGSPVTVSGTLTGTLATQTANTVFAGPSSGAAATPTFRSLVIADIPSGSGYYIQNQTGSNLAAQTAKFWITDTIKTNGPIVATYGLFTGTTQLSKYQGTDGTLETYSTWYNQAGDYTHYGTSTNTNKYGFVVSNRNFRIYAGVNQLVATFDSLKNVTVGNNLSITTVPALGTAATTFLTTNGGVVSSRTAAQVLSDIGAASSSSAITGLTGDVVATGPGNVTATIQPNVVTYAKFQQVAASSLVGNPTGTLANAQGITLGATLNFTGSSLQTNAFTGDFTTPANSFVATLATVNGSVGSWGSAASVPVFTVDAKGRITTVSNTLIQIGESQVTNLTADLASKANLSGATFTGTVILNADPTTALGAATKGYVDNLVTGLSWKQAVRAATTANITLSGTQTVDGIALVANDRVLVKNQTTASQNGLYLVAAGSWTRTSDASTGTQILGSAVYIQAGGTANGGTQYTNGNTTAPVIGTDAITYQQIAGAGVYTNGSGILLTGNVFSLDQVFTKGLFSATTATGITYTSGTGVFALSAIPNSSLANSTISGVALGGTLASVTFNNSGTGAASGTTFNGGTAQTISYNTIGAAPASGSGNYIQNTTIQQPNANFNISGTGVITNTANITAGGLNSFSSTNIATDIGTALSSSSVISSSIGELDYTSTASRTIGASNITTGGLFISKPVISGSSTITMTQGGGGIRSMSAVTGIFYVPSTAAATSTISHAAGLRSFLYADNTANLYTISNYYGVLIGNSQEFATGTSITNRWGVYQEGVNDKNFFAGNIQVGVTALQAWDANSRAIQVGYGGAIFAQNTNTPSIYLTSNTYYNGTNWVRGPSAIDGPTSMVIYNGLGLYRDIAGTVGSTYTPTQIFGVNQSGYINASFPAGVAGNFLVNNSGTISTRTAAQVLTDIGAASASGYVPYTGATGTVNLGTQSLIAGYLTLNNSTQVGKAQNTVSTTETYFTFYDSTGDYTHFGESTVNNKYGFVVSNRNFRIYTKVNQLTATFDSLKNITAGADLLLYGSSASFTGDITANNTANRVYTLPDKSGTFAMTSDLGSTTAALTMNNSGAGAASGTTFNGGTAQTISYNTIGAPSTTGTNASGTWGISVTGTAAGETLATVAGRNATYNGNVNFGASSLAAWNTGYRAIQFAGAGALWGDNAASSSSVYLTNNAVYTTAWTISNNATYRPMSLVLSNGTTSIFSNPAGAVGSTFSPSTIFSIDPTGTITTGIWNAGAVTSSGNGTFSGSVTGGAASFTTGTFSGLITSTINTGDIFAATSATTSNINIHLANSVGTLYIGIANSIGSYWATGSAGNNSGNIGTTTNTGFGIATNGILRYSIDATGNNTWTGSGNFSSNVTATSFITSGGTASQIQARDGSAITAGTGITISGGTISTNTLGKTPTAANGGSSGRTALGSTIVSYTIGAANAVVRFEWTLKINSISGGGTYGLNVNWTKEDGTAGTTQINAGVAAGNVIYNTPLIIRCKAGTAITVSDAAISGTISAINYDVYGYIQDMGF